MPGMCAKRDKGVPLLRRGWPLGNCFFSAGLAPKRITRRSQYARHQKCCCHGAPLRRLRPCRRLERHSNLQSGERGERRESAQEDEELRSARSVELLYVLLTAFRIA